MNCTESKQTIRQLPMYMVPEGSLANHLSHCELCQHYHSDLLLQQELAALQVPAPASDFLARALKHAVEPAAQSISASHRSWRWLSAMAASVLAATVMLQTFNGSRVNDIAQNVAHEIDQSRNEVRILIYSQADHDSAELSIELAENLELEGYAGAQRLAWSTKLIKGANVLTLPVLVRNNGGEVRVTSYFGDTNHEIRVQVTKRDKSVDYKPNQFIKGGNAIRQITTLSSTFFYHYI